MSEHDIENPHTEKNDDSPSLENTPIIEHEEIDDSPSS